MPGLSCVSVPRTCLSATGHIAERALQRIGAAGWSVSQAVWAALWLAAAAPGGYAGSVLTLLGWAADTAVNDSSNPRHPRLVRAVASFLLGLVHGLCPQCPVLKGSGHLVWL